MQSNCTYFGFRIRPVGMNPHFLPMSTKTKNIQMSFNVQRLCNSTSIIKMIYNARCYPLFHVNVGLNSSRHL